MLAWGAELRFKRRNIILAWPLISESSDSAYKYSKLTTSLDNRCHVPARRRPKLPA